MTEPCRLMLSFAVSHSRGDGLPGACAESCVTGFSGMGAPDKMMTCPVQDSTNPLKVNVVSAMHQQRNHPIRQYAAMPFYLPLG